MEGDSQAVDANEPKEAAESKDIPLPILLDKIKTEKNVLLPHLK